MIPLSNNSPLREALKPILVKNCKITAVQKNLRFSPKSELFEIPTRREYIEKDLASRIWASREQLKSFKDDSRLEMKELVDANPQKYLEYKDPSDSNPSLRMPLNQILDDLTEFQIKQENWQEVQKEILEKRPPLKPTAVISTASIPIATTNLSMNSTLAKMLDLSSTAFSPPPARTPKASITTPSPTSVDERLTPNAT